MRYMKTTYIIIAAWIIMFVLCRTTNIDQQLCGKGITSIRGEYYRFFTANMLHVNMVHLLINAAALFWAGYVYERRMGSIRFAVAAVLCAAAAQVVFSLLYPASQRSIGGSPIIFALCGFGIIMHLLAPDFPKLRLGTWSGNWLTIYLLGANLPVMPFMDISAVVIHGIAFAMGAAAAVVCRGCFA